MRILFVTQWFEPEPAFKGVAFAAALKENGHDVEVATGFPNYPGGKLYPGYRIRPYKLDRIEDVVVHRLAIWPSHNQSPIGRVANYVSFFISVLVFGLLRGRRYDMVYVYHPPVTPAVATAIFCSLFRRPFVVDIQDLWPDSVGSSGMASKRLTRLIGHFCDFVYRHATMIVLQSDRMLDRLSNRGIPTAKLRRIYNWATYLPSVAGDVRPSSFKGRFNIVYGGNLGQAQALREVIDAAILAGSTQSDIHLHLFGDGIERNVLAAHISSAGASCVTMHGPIGRKAMDRIFDMADVLVVQLKDDPLYEVTIPSKVQHYLACGRPIIAGLAGESADLLRASGAAIVCSPQDVPAMAAAMCQMACTSAAERRAMGNRGRDFYQANLGFERAINETLAVLSQARP